MDSFNMVCCLTYLYIDIILELSKHDVVDYYCMNNIWVFVSIFPLLHPHATSLWGVCWIHPVRPSIIQRLSIFLSKCLSDDTVCITWVKSLDGIKDHNHTSLDMCIMAYHVT